MYFEVKSDKLNNLREYKGAMYGEQTVALYDGGDYPTPGKLNRKEGEALKPGTYDLAPGCIGTDKHGNYVLGRIRLVPRGVGKA